ncbi:MAG: TetR/AcrR family transcriptional regulator [Pseudomonadales bacterium]
MAESQPKRKEEILKAAASVMGSNGVLKTRLQDVAEHLDVAYTALYHYFPSRDHMAEEVILWVLNSRLKALKEIEKNSALNQLLSFFSRDLSENNSYQVRFPPFNALPEENRRSLIDARNELLEELKDLIEKGIDEGSIRPCHSLTVANVVLGIVERYTPPRLQGPSQMSVKQIVAEMVGILKNGILSDETNTLSSPSYVISKGEDLLGYDPGYDSELKRLDSILSTATQHFNVEGAGASIPRMAAELGVSKTVIYQYIMDKQDLLLQCYLRGTRLVAMSHRIASDFGHSPLDEMLIHRQNLYRFHDSQAGPFTLINAIHFLHAPQQKLMRLRNIAIRETSIERMRRAVNAGQIRANVVPEIAQPLFGQILYALPGWYSDTYPLSIDEVCMQTGQVLFLGLKK